jgi:hypothetical protein
MTSLLSKKQIYTEDGCMLDNLLIQVGCLVGGLFGLVMSFYLALCFVQWVGDIIENKLWKWWL